ncbi:MAG: F0F1 ATP synthase subunit B [Candidatus Omnitrophica bacterium]|nr:F0F1 ATP synthase subunit B [Candidatus Omnitrophota bacterium]
MELLKMLSASEMIAQILSFFLLLFLLRHFAWKKILGLLDQRREKIRAEFEKIEAAKLQVAGQKADYESKIASIQEQAESRIKEAVQQARKITEEIRKSARQEAQDIITDARKQVEYEVSRSQEQLKDKIVDIALEAARTVIQEKLTEVGDRKIVEDFIKEIESVE